MKRPSLSRRVGQPVRIGQLLPGVLAAIKIMIIERRSP